MPCSSRRTHQPRPLAIALCLCLTSWCVPALAEVGPQAKAAAESLFDEGLQLMKEGKNEQACAKLEQSQQIDPGVGTLLYLGECYARSGRPASAWATFREAASLAGASGQSERAEQAKRRAAEVERRLAYLTISVAEEVRQLPGLTVKRAGENVGPEVLDIELPVDPGTVLVEVSAPGYEPYSTEVKVGERDHEQVKVPMLERAAEDGSAAASTEPSATPAADAAPALSGPTTADARYDSSAESGDTQRVLGLTLAGVGVVGLGIGTYFGLSAISKNSDAESSSCDDKVCQLRSDLDKVDDARSAATVSTFAFAGGAAALAGGLLLYWLAPDSPDTAWHVAPWVDADGVALTLEGRL